MLATLVTLMGCRAPQLGRDQDRLRMALLDMQTNQIMDNLIRAHNNVPILHIDYKTVDGQVKHNSEIGTTGTFTDATGAITNALGYTLGLKQENMLSVKGEPVRDAGVYMAYIEFLDKPGSLMQTAEPPPPGAAHLCRRFSDNCYYWIPTEYQRDFFILSLKASTVRGEWPRTTTGVEARIVQVDVIDEDDEKEEESAPSLTSGTPGSVETEPEGNDAVDLRLTFDREVDNDSGFMTFLFDGKYVHLPFVMMDEVKPGDKTKMLRTYCSRSDLGRQQLPFKPNDMAEKLKNLPVILHFARPLPEPSPSESLLQGIQEELRWIRLNQNGT